jgi:hypothetical protein
MQPFVRQLQQFDYNNRNGVFSMWSVPRSYLEDILDDPVSCQMSVEVYAEGYEDNLSP